MNIDNMIAVLTAYKEGKEIEIDIHQSWHTVGKNYKEFDFVNKTYRIKPEPKLIPFDYNDDLVGKVVKHKKINFKSTIASQYNDCCGLSGNLVSYGELLNDYTFLDGKPCGKYE